MTTITRETLELAALAAGIEFGIIHDAPHRRCEEGWTPWRPHTDIADAARLAVRLDLWAVTDKAAAFAAEDPDASPSECRHVGHDGTEPDKLRAWCEAITLCAAEIGRRMKESSR